MGCKNVGGVGEAEKSINTRCELFCSVCVCAVWHIFIFMKMPKNGIEYTKSALASIEVGATVKNYHLGSSSEVSVP